MLVNDELVRVLILLLLRSLKGKFGNNLEAIYVHDELKRADVKKKTYTSWRYLKLDSSFGTTLNWFPSKYLVKETQPLA